jgi:glc operon protein GlcG
MLNRVELKDEDSLGKGRTAALFKRPTKAFEAIVDKGRTGMTALPDFTPLEGGVPILIEGEVVGTIGVSGAASAQRDEELALAGARAVRPGIAKAGMPAPSRSRVRRCTRAGATRRGVADAHDWETDVINVLEGTATLVIGGAVVEPKVTELGQVRAAR